MEGRQVAQYLIKRKLGEGGMGEVYLARDTSLGRKVALKFISETLQNDEIIRKRFVLEAKAAAALDHPFICRVYDVAESEDRQFIVMEYVDGLTLEEEVSKDSLAMERVLQLGLEIAEALEEAHSKGFVHRDLKPSNVMITSRGHVRVMDFGLARQVDETGGEEAQNATELTGEHSVLGTVSYMSPEQVRGERADARSDIFSFGILLYEMLTGAHPFRRSTKMATAHAILGEEPEPLSNEYSDHLRELLTGMLAKYPAARIQSVTEVRTRLARLQKDFAAGWSARGNLWLLGFLGVFAVLAIVLVLAYLNRPSLLEGLQPSLRQVTFESGFAVGSSWSPDGRYIAYTSDTGGNFDICVQQLSGGSALRVTTSAADDSQPDWSPDGNQIVFRSSRQGGGIFVIPALGGNARKISSIGYRPQWSPDGSRILIATEPGLGHSEGREAPVRIIDLNGTLIQNLSVPGLRIMSAGWHPDGRVSLLGVDQQGELNFWTISTDGEQRIRSDYAPGLKRKISDGSFIPLTFLWSPMPADYLYLMAIAGGAPDLFRVKVGKSNLRWLTMPNPLTRSSTLEFGMALSSDGKNLAFTPGTYRTGIWRFPFDPVDGKILGEGELVSPSGMNATRPDMPLGERARILFRVFPPERVELWSKSPGDDRGELVAQGGVGGGRWSRDGTLLCYEFAQGEGTRFVLRDTTEQEVNLTSPMDGSLALSGFSSDGDWVLASLPVASGGDTVGIVKLPLKAAPRAEEKAWPVASHPEFNLWQPRFSPDDRWIVFVAIRRSDPQGAAALYVVPSSGGDWISITEGRNWNDKPRWAPDGRTIYFVSNRGGFFNVWGQKFDTALGRPDGTPFRVSNFRLPEKVVLDEVVELELTLNQDSMALPLMQVFAENIWVLENVDD